MARQWVLFVQEVGDLPSGPKVSEWTVRHLPKKKNMAHKVLPVPFHTNVETFKETLENSLYYLVYHDDGVVREGQGSAAGATSP